jgi:hypothetical protein
MANTIMDRTGLMPQTWLLALMYVCFVLNFTASASLNWRTPMEVLTGSTPDISPLLSFEWWEPVYTTSWTMLDFLLNQEKKEATLLESVSMMETP